MWSVRRDVVAETETRLRAAATFGLQGCTALSHAGHFTSAMNAATAPVAAARHVLPFTPPRGDGWNRWKNDETVNTDEKTTNFEKYS